MALKSGYKLHVELHNRSTNKCSAVAEMGDRLASIDMGENCRGGCAPFLEGGGAGPHLTQCGLG